MQRFVTCLPAPIRSATPRSGDRRKSIVLRYPTLPEKLCRSPMPFSRRLGFGPSLRNANTGERYPGGRIACRKRFNQAHQDEFVLNRGRFNFTGELGLGPAVVTLMARSSWRHHSSARQPCPRPRDWPPAAAALEVGTRIRSRRRQRRWRTRPPTKSGRELRLMA